MVKKKNEEIRKIPPKNYFVAILLVFIAVFITFYSFQWYKMAEEEKISKSYLMTSDTIIHEIKNLKEMDAVMLEVPDDYFIYISYTGSKEIYNLEKSLKPIIQDYKLREEFYYLNITDIKSDDNYLEELNNALRLPIKIEKVPTILYFRDGALVTDGVVVREDDKIIEAGDFQHLLDNFEISKTDH